MPCKHDKLFNISICHVFGFQIEQALKVYSKRQNFLCLAPQSIAVFKVKEVLWRKSSQIIFVVYYRY